MDKTSLTIIGAGICGLAASYLLSEKYSDIVVIEKHDAFGRETSSRNSEVIHAGIYYPVGSLKAQLCIQGKKLLYQLCKNSGISHQQLGKILIGVNDEEVRALEQIKINAEKNSVTNLRFLTSQDLQGLEPNIQGQAALLCPDTGIVDSHQLMKFFQDTAKQRKVEFAYNITVIGINKNSEGYEIIVREPQGETFSFQTRYVINAAGFDADKIAQMTGIDIEKNQYQIYYNKGQYFRIAHPEKFTIRHLIYPPPSKTDLGIHITPDLAGGLRLGPDARYVDDIDYHIQEADKEHFHKSVCRFLPSLTVEDLCADTVGIRAKLQAPDEDFRDFVVAEETANGCPGFINLLGIESPGLTACLAIAEKVKKFIDAQ